MRKTVRKAGRKTSTKAARKMRRSDAARKANATRKLNAARKAAQETEKVAVRRRRQFRMIDPDSLGGIGVEPEDTESENAEENAEENAGSEMAVRLRLLGFDGEESQGQRRNPRAIVKEVTLPASELYHSTVGVALRADGTVLIRLRIDADADDHDPTATSRCETYVVEDRAVTKLRITAEAATALALGVMSVVDVPSMELLSRLTPALNASRQH